VILSNPDRVLYPEQGLTKLDLARYYEAVEEWILPHITERPLMLVRCPQGRGKYCFYQKHLKDEASPAVHAVDIREENGENEPYLYVRDLAGVVSLVQLGTLEFHGWGARQDDVERPDRLVFDLDPDAGLAWESVVEAALELRTRLADAGLETWVQTTGGKGVHVIAPIQRRHDWSQVKPFCRAIAEAMSADSPALYVSQASKAARRGKIFIDWLRNGRGATAIVPYSSRARAGAPVATPIAWSELNTARPAFWSVETVPGRLAKLRADPWAGFWRARQSLRIAVPARRPAAKR
jgi:bifunctional non-homologous end joining protein LigD